jgi:hypothetical protein
MMRAWTLTRLPAALTLFATLCACDTDPVHSSAVDALGPEVAGVPKGPFHRAGQPCLTCHGGEGPASQQFAMAGTVFFGPGNASPATFVGVENAQVVLEDDSQAQHTATTNCVGNFYVLPGDWPGHPQFPVIVRVVGQPEQTVLDVPMQSHIGRQGSCAACHQVPNSENLFETPGVIHLSGTDDPNFAGDPSCAVSPVLRPH